MGLTWAGLDRPDTWIQGETHLQWALAASCSAVVAIGSILFAARRFCAPRRERRRYVGRPVLVCWRDREVPRQSDDGFCEDLSSGGMGLDLPFPLAIGTRVNLRMSEAKLSRSGVVRRCARAQRGFAVGVQFDNHGDEPAQA